MFGDWLEGLAIFVSQKVKAQFTGNDWRSLIPLKNCKTKNPL
jgi:hypothetical protein